jgi:acetyl-CoA carboxylase, biotin carboxylase subunit
MQRAHACARLVADGIEATLPLSRAPVAEPDVIDGNYPVHWLEQFLSRRGVAE